MKNFLITALFLSLAACSESPTQSPSAKLPAKNSAPSSQTTANTGDGSGGSTPSVDPVVTPVVTENSSIVLKNGGFELTSTSLNPKMKREEQDRGSVLYGVRADFKLSGLGNVKIDLTKARVQIVTAQTHDCKLTTLDVSNPDANGVASFNLEGIDDQALGACEKLMYDVFHEGAYFDFYGVGLSGMPSGETQANLSLMMRPF